MRLDHEANGKNHYNFLSVPGRVPKALHGLFPLFLTGILGGGWVDNIPNLQPGKMRLGVVKLFAWLYTVTSLILTSPPPRDWLSTAPYPTFSTSVVGGTQSLPSYSLQKDFLQHYFKNSHKALSQALLTSLILLLFIALLPPCPVLFLLLSTDNANFSSCCFSLSHTPGPQASSSFKSQLKCSSKKRPPRPPCLS